MTARYPPSPHKRASVSRPFRMLRYATRSRPAAMAIDHCSVRGGGLLRSGTVHVLRHYYDRSAGILHSSGACKDRLPERDKSPEECWPSRHQCRPPRRGNSQIRQTGLRRPPHPAPSLFPAPSWLEKAKIPVQAIELDQIPKSANVVGLSAGWRRFWPPTWLAIHGSCIATKRLRMPS
jgi:hypothetical protein